MDRCEAGADDASIAAELGLSDYYVRKVRTLYTPDGREERAWVRAARLSDAAFLAAVRRSGGSFARAGLDTMSNLAAQAGGLEMISNVPARGSLGTEEAEEWR